MANYTILLQARQDLDEIAHFIAKDNLQAALKIYDNARETFENLAEYPFIGHSYSTLDEELEKALFFPMKDYSKYLIFYLPDDDGIIILRVIHSARNIRNLTLS